MEPSPIRNNGPYPGYREATDQFTASTYGIPGDDHKKSVITLREALMIAGVMDLTDFEENSAIHIGKELPPATIQVIAGWIIRAHLAGRDANT